MAIKAILPIRLMIQGSLHIFLIDYDLAVKFKSGEISMIELKELSSSVSINTSYAL
ncbi:hypothetical protein HJ039_02200 [Vibrio parahaemolyticus]|nr:hypothetical protein [Vibrio parahaemolyticus]